ncbi:MAG TPA: Gfo/Idh/MocA family oxidoreductase [Thermoleophilaceae bacterium]|nr:Gfo/Idh/MocA family oxidoreductase [Thermoleophilaceae bacterium]
MIGYGLAGSAFHAPLVEAVPGLSLASIVTSNPERAEQARAAHPGVEVLPDAGALFARADSHDLVVVAAPNREHVPLGLAAVEAGLHLVVDKPLAASVADAQRLADAVEARGVVASVFHNRRWDGDFLTLSRLVSDGSLGEPVRLESRFDRWRPEVDADRWREAAAPEDAGGLLFDLGPHLIDQALELLGPARSVYAEVRALRPGAQVDDDVFLALEHESGVRSQLWATVLAAQPGPRLRALGTRAAYVKLDVDVQEEQLRAGARPGDPGFGEEPPEAWGLVGTEDDAQPVQTERGRYVEFYEGMEKAIRSGEPPPVPLAAGIATLRVIEAAQASATRRDVVPL